MSASDDKSLDRNSRIDAKLKLLDYHRKAIESRRTLSYQAFLGMLGFYFVLFQAIERLIPLIDPSLEHLLRWLMTAVVLLVFALFLAFSWQVEVRNAADRTKYGYLETDLWTSVVSVSVGNNATFHELARRSWATTWPLLTLLVLSVALLAVIWAYTHTRSSAGAVPGPVLSALGPALLSTALALGVKAFQDAREYATTKDRRRLISAICSGLATLMLAVAGTHYIRG
jgi:hypothetical protein